MEGLLGGFVLGTIVDRADSIVGFSPQAAAVHFVATVRAGPADICSEVVHHGRETASTRLELRQDGRVRAHAMVSSVISARSTTWCREVDTTTWGDPETTPASSPSFGQLSYDEHVQVRRIDGAPERRGTQAWVRLRTPPSEHGLKGPAAVAAVFLDLLDPGPLTFPVRPRFVPTVDFSAHFTPQLPDLSDTWCHVSNECVWTGDRFCVDESTLHHRDGRVLAQVRQGRAIRWR
jgi:hypothetical protein